MPSMIIISCTPSALPHDSDAVIFGYSVMHATPENAHKYNIWHPHPHNNSILIVAVEDCGQFNCSNPQDFAYIGLCYSQPQIVYARICSRGLQWLENNANCLFGCIDMSMAA